MKKKLAIAFVFIGLCMSIGLSYGEISLIMNGSFEQDGMEISKVDIVTNPPLYWYDVNIPSVAFECSVRSDWWTHSLYSETGFCLTLETALLKEISLDEMASFSQQVYIEQEITNLSFDLRLGGAGAGSGWDHQKIRAEVRIDGEVIWDSNGLELDQQNEFEGTVVVDSNDFNDFLNNDWHTLTLDLRSLVDDSFPLRTFFTDWDFVKFDKYCGGLGYLPGDFSQDCYIYFPDFALFAQHWLQDGPPEKYDLYEDGEVNNLDLMLLAEEWLFNSDWTKWGQEGTDQMELLDLDLDLSGQIDSGELLMLQENWLQEPPPHSLINQYPDEDEIINFKDFAVFAQQWGYKDWIYYLD